MNRETFLSFWSTQRHIHHPVITKKMKDKSFAPTSFRSLRSIGAAWIVGTFLSMASLPLVAADTVEVEEVCRLRLKKNVGQDDLATKREIEESCRQLSQALDIYLKADAPRAQHDITKQVLSNLAARVKAMKLSEIEAMVRDAENVLIGVAGGFGPSANFKDSVDAVVLFTIASDEFIASMDKRIKLKDTMPKTAGAIGDIPAFKWSRLSTTPNTRVANEKIDWKLVQDRYTIRKRLDSLEWGIKTPFNMDLKTKARDERDWIDKLEQRLLRLYAKSGLSNDRDFSHDLARAQYLMIGVDDKGARYGPNLLANFNAALQDFSAPKVGALDDKKSIEVFSKLSFEVQLFASQKAELEILVALEKAETKHGFRPERLLPDGILTAEQFFDVVGAGYMPNDVGAGIEHGSLSHRLQWHIIITDFEQRPGEWFLTPLDLYTRIGQFDQTRETNNLNNLFEFERPPSLWAQLFDQQGGAGNRQADEIEVRGMDRPDFTRAILKQAGMENIRQRLEVIYAQRYNRGRFLAEQYSNPTKGRILKRSAKFPFALTEEDKERIDQLVEKNAMSRLDELYMLEYFDSKVSSNEFDRAKNNGLPLPILIQKGKTYNKERDEEEIYRQGLKHKKAPK
jgi:hypothetical protein